MVFMDQPDHGRVRRALQAAFTPRAIEGLRPRVTALVAEHLASMPLDADVMAGLAVPLPAIVVAEVLGVPPAERDRFVAWSHALVEFVGTGRTNKAFLAGTQDAMREWAVFFAELATQQRSSVLATLLEQQAGGQLSWDELIANAIFLLAAGHETTTNLIGNGLLALARHPAEWARLRSDPRLAQPAVEELLRFDAPVQLVGRSTEAPIEIAGATIPANADLVVVVGAANRDPVAFGDGDDPDVLRLDRQPNRHLAFVQGPHHCLGAALARLEGQVVFEALAARYLRLQPPDRPQWRRNPAFRGLEALRLTP